MACFPFGQRAGAVGGNNAPLQRHNRVTAPRRHKILCAVLYNGIVAMCPERRPERRSAAAAAVPWLVPQSQLQSCNSRSFSCWALCNTQHTMQKCNAAGDSASGNPGLSRFALRPLCILHFAFLHCPNATFAATTASC